MLTLRTKKIKKGSHNLEEIRSELKMKTDETKQEKIGGSRFSSLFGSACSLHKLKFLFLFFGWFLTVYPQNFQPETNHCSRRVGPSGVNRWPMRFF